MWTVLFIAVLIGIVVLFVVLHKRGQKPPVVSPTPIPSPIPSPTPLPGDYTELHVYNSGMNTQNIISIRVDGKLVIGGEFPVKPGKNVTFITDQVGSALGIQVRFLGTPAGTESISIHADDFSDCITGPGSTVEFHNVPVNGNIINIDYDEVGCA